MDVIILLNILFLSFEYIEGQMTVINNIMVYIFEIIILIYYIQSK